jgi:hypothetical protein
MSSVLSDSREIRAIALQTLFNCGDRCSDSRARCRPDLSEMSAGRSPCDESSRGRYGCWHTPNDSRDVPNGKQFSFGAAITATQR